MSTITSPRDTSVNGRRVPLIVTPTTSSRPSFEHIRSADASPSRAPSFPAQPKRNRAALREYYNLKKTAAAEAESVNDGASEASSIHDYSEVGESELDRPDFDAEAFIKHALETQSLAQLLRTYNGVLTDIRALDAERKALVYDNYSKLIAATETIRKMRVNMDPLNPMAKTLDPAIASIYERAETIKSELRDSMPEWQRRERELEASEREESRTKARTKSRTKEVVLRVLNTPEKVRGLLNDGKENKARKLWEETSRLLERWKERGVGGDDVQNCIDDGEAALRGEGPNEKSWVNTQRAKS